MLTEDNLFIKTVPKRRLGTVYLSESVLLPCAEMIDEIKHRDLLRKNNLEPRNRLLLVGTPGNGKTTLAEALAGELGYTLYTVRYDAIMGSDIGRSAEKLPMVFEKAGQEPCALFFDEFDTIGRSRNDSHDTSGFKRLVSSLLVQIDHLPGDTLVMAATNLESALDNAVWRRFHIKVVLERPQREELVRYFDDFEKRYAISFGTDLSEMADAVYGKSYSEAEALGLSVVRQMILHPYEDAGEITAREIKFHKHQKNIF